MIKELIRGYPYKPEKGCFGYSTCIIVDGVLFDTGSYNVRKMIIENLADIKCVVISHLHFDHCSNLDLFINTNIPIYISSKEIHYYNFCRNSDTDLFSYFSLIKDKLNIIEINSDINLTSNIKIIATPGHTPGHISLSIKENHKCIICAGDAIKTYHDYSTLHEYGNAVNSVQYVNTKNYLIHNYDIIFPGHDGKIEKNIAPREMEVEQF